MTYRVPKPTPLECMEGDNTEFTFIVPAHFDMQNRLAKMQVRSTEGVLLFEKNITNGITITGQYINITIAAENTKNKYGSHLWEMETTHADEGIITIANGTFKIKKEICQ